MSIQSLVFNAVTTQSLTIGTLSNRRSKLHSAKRFGSALIPPGACSCHQSEQEAALPALDVSVLNSSATHILAEHVLPFHPSPTYSSLCSWHTKIRAGFLSRCAQLVITLGIRLPDLLRPCPVPVALLWLASEGAGWRRGFHSSASI